MHPWRLMHPSDPTRQSDQMRRWLRLVQSDPTRRWLHSLLWDRMTPSDQMHPLHLKHPLLHWNQ